MSFTWIPFYKELAQKLLQFRNNRTPLVNWIYDNLDGYINHLKDASDGRRVPDIDPFTVFAIFNRGISHDRRRSICEKFKDFLNISSSIPQDFNGIPVMNTQKTNFMAFEANRKDGDIERLWNVFEAAVMDKDIETPYNALSGQYLIKFNLTIGLFWIRPDKYLPLDSTSQDLLNSLGISFDKTKFLPYNEYVRVMQTLNETMNTESHGFSNYAEFSFCAFQQKQSVQKEHKTHKDNSTVYWTYSPGENAYQWQRCISEGIICIGWDFLGKLFKYSSREEMRKAIQQHHSTDASFKNASLAVWQFANEMKPGDIVFAKRGRSTIIGRGIVESDYMFDDNQEKYKHIRKVRWTNLGDWPTDDKTAMKTLTNITRYKDLVMSLNKLVDGTGEKVAEPENQQYWWLVANPDIWSLASLKVGNEQNYSFISVQ